MKCFDMFEAGDIKGQTLTSKQLMTKPEVKQTQFQCLLPLNEDIQEQLLSQVISQDLSLKDLKKKCEKEKKMCDLQEKFVHLTNSKSWKDAETRFPVHTKRNQLEQFLALNIRKSTPQAFSQFCAQAVLHTAEPDQGVDVSEINKCTFVEVANIDSLDPSVVTSSIKKYAHTGGSLFVAYLEKVSSLLWLVHV